MEDPRMKELRELIIDSTIDFLKCEINEKSINAARAVLKDLSPREGGEGMTDTQAQNIKDAMGDAPFKFGT